MLYLLIIPTTPENPGIRKFSCRIEELPTLSKFLINSLEHDQADFSADYPEMNADYLAEFRKKRDLIMSLLHPKKITADLKRITKRILKNMRGMRTHLRKLEVSARLADKKGELTMSYKDMGIGQVREAISKADVEEFDGAMGLLKQNISEQYAALTNHGYSNAKRDALYKLWDLVNDDNAKQNLLTDERDSLAEANINTFNELWDIMIDVCVAGKSIYAFSSPAHTDEYTMESLKNRVRNEDRKARFRRFNVPKGGSISILRVADQSKAENTGTTILAVHDSLSDEPIALQPGEQLILNNPSGTLVVVNRSTATDGEIKVKVFAQ
ncbi:MAG: hypothetical protein HY841_12940 [Bacteroidetes bacterium]|nr:hypothetical protein [Bacteroidota bacterium]